MKFSPQDIISQTFSSKLMGYAPEQVDEFLVSLANEWSRLTQELEHSKKQNKTLDAELKECRRREHGLHDALQMAKRLGDDVRQQAERDAELLLEEANDKAEKLISSAQQRVNELSSQIDELQQQKIQFEHDLRSMIESHLSRLDLIDSLEATPIHESDVIGDYTDSFRNYQNFAETTNMQTVKRRPASTSNDFAVTETVETPMTSELEKMLEPIDGA